MDIEVEDTNGIDLLDGARVTPHEQLLDTHFKDSHALIHVELHVQPVPVRCQFG